MRKYLFSLVIIFIAIPSFAGRLEISDFGCRLEADVPKDASVARVSVPDQVYMCCVRPDLGDLRVFGSNGILPHSIRRPLAERSEAPLPVDLPFFPVYMDEGNSGSLSLHVKTGEAGSIIDLRTDSERKRSESPVFWLFDASKIKGPISGLMMDWIGPKGLVFDVRIEAGDDLSSWRVIKSSVTLADLDYAGHSLSIKDVDLAFLNSRYLRISWPKEAESARLSSVKARLPKSGKEPEIRWMEIKGHKSASSSGKTVYEFDTRGVFPVERVDLLLPQGTGVMQGSFMSRPDLASNWRPRHTGVFYGLVFNGRILKGGSASINPVSDRFWRFETSSEAASFNDASPSLKIGWIPHELFFVPSGSRTCTIAFGRNGLTQPSDNSVNVLVSSLSANHDFKPSEVVISADGIKEGRFDPPSQSLPWRKMILWAVLFFGVALIGLMAWKLYRQMGDE